jgi:L-ascorbate metabolism protein UlaG (beta-lactamase superfamily)
VKITFLGHAAVLIEGSKTVLVDPFLTGNPVASITPDDVKKCDLVIVTHDHGDHLGDAFDICKKTGAVLVSVHELAVTAESSGIKAEGMNVGGTIDAAGVTIHMTTAQHSSEHGHQVGVVLELDGHSLYHAGDTGLFSDMKLIGEFLKPELAFLPIGDRYTMGERSAAKAVEFLGVSKVIPIHYGTFPILTGDPQRFADLTEGKAEVVVLKPGESYDL